MEETFHRDLAEGKERERLILKRIQEEYKDAHIIEGYCKEGDIFIPSIKQFIEVKSDEKSQETNNIVIEIEHYGKPSALKTTKAMWWMITTGKKLIKITPDQIEMVIARHNLKPVRFTGTGDTHEKEAYLIYQPLLEEQAISVEVYEQSDPLYREYTQ